MAHNSHIRGSDTAGDWPVASVVTSAEFATLAGTGVFKSINGDDGGTWAPSTQIIIGGSGLQITGASSFSATSSLTMTGTNRVSLASRTITRVEDYFGPTYVNADWTFQGTPHHIVNVGTNKTAWQSMHFPDGATITEVAALIQGAAHGGSWPPATPNRIGLYEVSLANGGSTLLGTFTNDSTAVQATYESEHWLVMSGLSTVVDRTLKCYRLAFITENGANAIAGQAFDAVRVKYTTTSYDED